MKLFGAIFCLLLTACASSTREGEVGVQRKQFFLLSSSQVTTLSAQGYEQTKKEAEQKSTLDKDKAQYERVKQVSDRVIPFTTTFREDAKSWAWEVHVITSAELNAYCMPGGKIMFYSGIIETLKLTDAEIAAIMGHEIAHALREHGRERMSEQLISSLGLTTLLALGKLKPEQAGALNMATNVVVALPHSRTQESEADEIGLELMARAGYNPEEAVNLWKKMAAQGGSKPPELLSTHPADATRIKNIESLLPKVMPLYRAAARK